MQEQLDVEIIVFDIKIIVRGRFNKSVGMNIDNVLLFVHAVVSRRLVSEAEVSIPIQFDVVIAWFDNLVVAAKLFDNRLLHAFGELSDVWGQIAVLHHVLDVEVKGWDDGVLVCCKCKHGRHS